MYRMFKKKMEKFIDELAPGVMIMPNEDREYWDATPEEIEAFMDLIEEMTTF